MWQVTGVDEAAGTPRSMYDTYGITDVVDLEEATRADAAAADVDAEKSRSQGLPTCSHP